ncbi:MAG: polysaccharide pyruvyl transferase family protein [Phocaeicola sp.]
MNFKQKIDQLKSIIESTLTPLIDNDYILLDLPYYSNIGDTLIWDGTREFLNKTNKKNLYSCSHDTFKNKSIKTDTTILLQGGGNFGDIWRRHQNFRLDIIARYPNNRIIILPQTIYYEENSNLLKDAESMSKHKDLHICARDSKSFELLQKHFKNKHLLVPDMAFCIPPKSLDKYRSSEKEVALFLKRTDKELSTTNYTPQTNLPIDTKDWPSMETLSCIQRKFEQIKYYSGYVEKIIGQTGRFYFINQFAHSFYRPDLIKQGVRFVSSYKEIYTTRLHVAILSILLNKEFKFIDNSYGKNSTFFNTWLSDLDNVELLTTTNL